MKVTMTVPHPGAVINQSDLEKLRIRGMFLGQQVFASLVEYGQPTIPTDAARPKYFTSLSNLGIFIDGSLVLDGTYAAAFSDPAFSIYSPTLAQFYRDRTIAKDVEFQTIPRLVIRELPDAGKLNFSPDVQYTKNAVASGKTVQLAEAELRAGRTVSAAEQPWAFGALLEDPTGPIERDGKKYRAMFPSNIGLKYENGIPVAFDYQEYSRAFPLQTIVTVGGGGGAKGVAVIKPGVDVRQALFTAMLANADLNKAVLDLVEVK